MSHRLTRLSAAIIVATLSLTGLLGCGGDKGTNPPPPPGGASTTFTGTVTGTGANGTLSITVATTTLAPQNAGFRAQATVTATGSFTPSGGAAIALSGGYDEDNDQVGLTGGGWTFGGVLSLSGNGMEGNALGPGGELGYFSVIKGGAEVIVLVGTYTSTTVPAGENGNFNLSISGAEVHGWAVNDAGDTAIQLDGTYASATGDITIVNPANPTGPPLATGNYNSTTGEASGIYNDETGAQIGTWMGTRQ